MSMATDMELFSQVEGAVREVLNTKEGDIKAESYFRADLGAESIDLLDISFELEKRTGKELDFREVVQFVNEKRGTEISDLSVQDIVEYLKAASN
jgi:acyl carrier protein